MEVTKWRIDSADGSKPAWKNSFLVLVSVSFPLPPNASPPPFPGFFFSPKQLDCLIAIYPVGKAGLCPLGTPAASHPKDVRRVKSLHRILAPGKIAHSRRAMLIARAFVPLHKR